MGNFSWVYEITPHFHVISKDSNFWMTKSLVWFLHLHLHFQRTKTSLRVCSFKRNQWKDGECCGTLYLDIKDIYSIPRPLPVVLKYTCEVTVNWSLSILNFPWFFVWNINLSWFWDKSFSISNRFQFLVFKDTDRLLTVFSRTRKWCLIKTNNERSETNNVSSQW